MGARVLANRYELLDKIGEGGMAVVFKAKDRMLERNVAVKILRPEYIKDDGFIESFRRESQLVAGIVDQNIVTVYDVGQQGNIYYIVMELVEGEALSDIIKREGRLDAKKTASYGRQIAMALSTAHKNNLIHRDIKPHNIMVTHDGIAKLMDFGIAKRVSNDTMLEEKEAVMGSIHYFSPEQARGQHVDERSDIYSLGIVMYEMITGKVPFDGDNAVEVAVKHMNEEMIPPSHVVDDVPQDLEDIILKATSKNPDDRYSNAEEMITDLNFIKFSRIAVPPEINETEKIDEDDSDVKIHPHHGEYASSKMSDTSLLSGDSEKSEKKKKSKKDKSPVNFAVILAVVLAIAISIPLSKLISNKISGKNQDSDIVQVPHLEDLSLDEATDQLEALGLGITVDSQIINDDKEEGTVLSYSPSEGTTVKKGQTIKVNVSKRSTAKTVPNLYMLEVSAAKIKIQQNGYTVGTITEKYDETVPEGYIISSNPGSGVKLEKGSAVNLVVSAGIDPSTRTSFSLDLVGLTEEEAIALITEKGCQYEVKRTANQSVEYGHVYMQSPTSATVISNDEAAEKVYIIYVSNYSASNIEPDIENDVTLVMDMSLAESDPFYVSVTVSANGESAQQYSRVEIQKTGDDQFSLDIHGAGQGTATVTFDNRMVYIFDVDFDAQTATPTYVYTKPEE